MTLFIGLFLSYLLLMLLGLIGLGWGLAELVLEKRLRGVGILLVGVLALFASFQNVRATDLVRGRSAWRLCDDGDGSRTWRLVEIKENSKESKP